MELHSGDRERDRPAHSYRYSSPPNTALLLIASPKYSRWFSSPEYFFLGYMTPFIVYRRFLILPFFASPESSRFKNVTTLPKGHGLIYKMAYFHKDITLTRNLPSTMLAMCLKSSQTQLKFEDFLVRCLVAYYDVEKEHCWSENGLSPVCVSWVYLGFNLMLG